MKTKVFSVLLALLCFGASAQQKFEGSFAFETDPAKKYAIYEPSTYSDTVPNKLMVAFHPFNTSRWDARSWRDTLTAFAENSGLILICPDGGSDGRVDDDIDYGFTTALIDSTMKWYNINTDKIFAMGFSVGGKAMYQYGLTFSSVFAGFIPIGAAINGTSDVTSLLDNALCESFYIVHGENDSPGTRYTPIKNALEQNKAEVNSIFMAGVGHTIDFPNRNKVLKDAFNWVDTVSCKTIIGVSTPLANSGSFKLYPTAVSQGLPLTLAINLESSTELTIEIWSIDGKLVSTTRGRYQQEHISLPVQELKQGIYQLRVQGNAASYTVPFVVQ